MLSMDHRAKYSAWIVIRIVTNLIDGIQNSNTESPLHLFGGFHFPKEEVIYLISMVVVHYS